MDMGQSGHLISFTRAEQFALTSGVAARLLTASVLGGFIGLDREYRHQAAGIRTNMLIAFGAALFTLLSAVVAGDGSPNKGQIASNIVQGVGFLGAGLILHNRNRVSGLTSAATVFAVASIGMACGAGLYIPSVFATVVVLGALEVVGAVERGANLKSYTLIYEARGEDALVMEDAILKAMDRGKQRFADVERDTFGQLQRVSFSVKAPNRVHRQLEQALRSDKSLNELLTFRDWEDE
jgi:putative Mg2+ transporter-C (MgtC) family protein